MKQFACVNVPLKAWMSLTVVVVLYFHVALRPPVLRNGFKSLEFIYRKICLKRQTNGLFKYRLFKHEWTIDLERIFSNLWSELTGIFCSRRHRRVQEREDVQSASWWLSPVPPSLEQTRTASPVGQHHKTYFSLPFILKQW